MTWQEDYHEKDRKEKLATYLFAMKEDLSEWIAGLMNIAITADTFMSTLDNGVLLCRLANMIQKAAEKYLCENPESTLKLPEFLPTYKERGGSYGSFISRDNVANFIRWCREFGIQDVIMFESEDLVLHKFQKPVILTLLDVARRASKFDIEPPDLVIMEEQIDEEIALEEAENLRTLRKNEKVTDEGTKDVVVKLKTPRKKEPRKKVKNFIPKNLDTLVKEIVEECTCKDSFPVEKIADGKYKIGESRVLIFVRVMRNHVMVRVGGGWDTLDNYILKHDPCRSSGRSGTSCSGGKQRSKCQTSNHHESEANSLQSPSNTSVASSDSSSSTSSVARLSPVNNNNNNVLQGMMCVFGESGSRPDNDSEDKVSPVGDAMKRTNSRGKIDRRPLNTPTRQTGECKGLGSRHGSLNDVRDSSRNTTKKKSGKTLDKKTQALQFSQLEAEIAFNRSRTSDAILSRSKQRSEAASDGGKRRGNFSREPSSENLRGTLPRRSGSARRKVGSQTPEIRRRSGMTSSSARKKLESEYEESPEKNKKDLRKSLTDNRLIFSRSFSDDKIVKGMRRHSISSRHGSPSRIPVPITNHGKPRGSRQGSPRVTNGSSTNCVPNITTKCSHCIRGTCTCDEGFIDGDVTRTSLRPTSLFINSHNHVENFDKNCKDHKKTGKCLATDCKVSGVSGECWKEVLPDILRFEEKRISDKNF